MSDESDDTRATALCGQILSHCTILMLRKKGVLTEEEVGHIFDQSLAHLERQQAKYPQDPSIASSRQILEKMIPGKSRRTRD